MYKVMLVDDERLILQGVLNIIDWEKLGMEVIHMAENGKEALDKYKEKLECLKDGNVFTDSIIDSFKYGSLDKWKKELRHRIIHDDMELLRGYVKLHNKENMDALDEVNWNKISDIKFNIMKDTLTRKSLFTRINDAIDAKDYEKVSELQLELSKYMKEIRVLYSTYKKNIY